MPRLITSHDVRFKLSLGNVDTFISAADDATEEATLHLAADLRTSLVRATYEDVWLLDNYDSTSALMKLQLRAGFVDAATVQIGTGYTMADATADTSLTALAAVGYEKGQVTITEGVLYKYVSVRYEAGFPLITDDPDELLDLTLAPAWLAEAAMAKAVSVMASHPEFSRKEGTALDGKAYARQYASLVAPRIRYLPGFRVPTV